MTDLRPCCQQAVLDGIPPRDHFDLCDARCEDPPESDALFDVTPPKPKRGPQL